MNMNACLIPSILAASFVGTAEPLSLNVPAPGGTAGTITMHAVWLRVPDIKGSYTIPYIQSSNELTIKTAFTAPETVKAQVTLLKNGKIIGDAQVTTPENPTVTFPSLPPGEYAVAVAGVGATGNTVSEDLHERIGIGTVVAAIGDSITEGYHSRGFWRDNLDLTPDAFPSDAVSKDGRNYPQYTPTTAHHRPDINCFASWMPKLNDMLVEKWRRPVFIANEGWGGITTERYLAMMRTDKRWQERMRLLKPTIWLIHLGVNDERAKLGAEIVAANLTATVDLLRKDYAAEPSNIFICTPCYDYVSGADKILSDYCVVINKLITEKGLRKGPDFFAAYAKDKEKYYGADPVHPNIEGMELMAKLWAEAITK